MNRDTLTLTFAMLGAAGALGQGLPPLSEILRADPDDEQIAAWVRSSQGTTAALFLLLGAGASLSARSATPLIFAAIVAGYLVFSYEQALMLGTS